MREVYHAELDQLGHQLADLAQTADQAMNDATLALMHADRALADRVIAEQKTIEGMQQELDDRAIDLLARQQPVATELRTIVACLRTGADLQRMGVLAQHVAELAVRRHPRQAVPTELRPMIEQMGEVARRLVGKARAVLQSQDVEAALELDQDDDEMDRLEESLYAKLLGDQWRPDTQTAMDIALIGRYYERYADHAVSVAKRVAFIAGRNTHVPQS